MESRNSLDLLAQPLPFTAFTKNGRKVLFDLATPENDPYCMSGLVCYLKGESVRAYWTATGAYYQSMPSGNDIEYLAPHFDKPAECVDLEKIYGN